MAAFPRRASPTFRISAVRATRLPRRRVTPLVERPDGLMYLDPEKAKGRKDLCEFEGVYWNEALQIPQTCTGCAHPA